MSVCVRVCGGVLYHLVVSCPALSCLVPPHPTFHPPTLPPTPSQTPEAISAYLAARADIVRFLAPVAYEVVAPCLCVHELPDESARMVGEPLEAGSRVLVQARWAQG